VVSGNWLPLNCLYGGWNEIAHIHTCAPAQTQMHGGTGLHLTVKGKSPRNSAW